MFYPITDCYGGPNRSDPKNIYGEDVGHIATEPATGNCRPYRSIVDGWCGTTNDWSKHAHGEFETREEAEAVLTDRGLTYSCEPGWEEQQGVEYFTTREGAADHWQAEDWLHDARGEMGITATTNDSDLLILAERYESEAEEVTDSNPAGVVLVGTMNYLRSIRDELRES